MSSIINLKELLQEKRQTLSSHKHFKVLKFNISDGITTNRIATMEQVLKQKIPLDLLEIYSQVNGFEFEWLYNYEEKSLFGFWDFWPLEKVFFGVKGKIDPKSLQNTFKDVLWNQYFSNEEIEELKKHKIIESISGKDAFVTIKINGIESKLFYIYEGECNQISLNLETYTRFVINTFGLNGVREQLVKDAEIVNNPYSNSQFKFLSTIVPIAYE